MAIAMAIAKPQKLDSPEDKNPMPKQKYRTYGTGSLYYNKNLDLWIGTLEAGWTAKGTRKRITVSARDKTKARKNSTKPDTNSNKPEKPPPQTPP